MKILFVCLGNICRSPLAEESFRQKVRAAGRQADFEVIDSAGMIDYHEGALADERMRDIAYRHGLKLTHRSRPITESDFHTFDRIIAMDADNLRRLREKAPQPELLNKVTLLSDYLTKYEGFTAIPDPYYGTEKDFQLVVDLCDDACQHLLETL